MIQNVNSIRQMCNDGISLIPVKGADGGKKPFAKWQGDVRTLSYEELIKDIEFWTNKSNTNVENIAIRTGRRSGGVVCIDVDVKHKEGFGAIILNDFRTLYPDIYYKLRIDKSPSGGYHFYYRIAGYNNGFGDSIGEIPSIAALASRLATDEELKIRPDIKKWNFLELKAEGNLSHCYPSTSYLRIKESNSESSFREGMDDTIGVLTIEDHHCLIATCKLYDEVPEIAQSKIKQNVDELYSENPFESFNKSEDGARVLYEEGWKLFGTYVKFERYQKPGRNNKDIDATFNLETRVYRIFGTNAGIDAKGYTPAALHTLLKFGKVDKDTNTQMYQWLVAKGYGTLKPSIEKNIVRRAIKQGAPLQANVSEEGKAEYHEQLTKKKEKYQYGIFWEVREEGGYRISREGIYKVGKELGFRYHKKETVYIDGYMVKIIDERFFFDKIKDYIVYGINTTLNTDSDVDFFSLDAIGEQLDESGVEEVDIELLDAYESFLQNSGKFTISRLPIFDDTVLLKSNKRVSYKFYKNCYVKIEADGRETFDYKDMDFLIWEKDIIDRNFGFMEADEYKNSLYYQFVQNAIGWGDYLTRCIGFCAHDYRDEDSYFILATEQCENPTEGGGSGKNIFCNLFKLITSVKVSAGSMVKKDNQFLQSWNYQRIFILADLPKKFDMEFFKELINGEASVRKLYKDEFDVSVYDMPKFIASTNFSFDIHEPGIRRRVRQIEFSDYYIKRGGVNVVHDDKMFPLDWSETDYLAFDNIMIGCIQSFLKNKCKIEEIKLSNSGWVKQFELKFTHLYSFIRENIEKWVFMHQVSNLDFMNDYKKFQHENNINKGLSNHTLNIALTEYCSKNNIDFKHKLPKKDGTWTDGIVWKNHLNISTRGKLFGNPPNTETQPGEDDPPF